MGRAVAQARLSTDVAQREAGRRIFHYSNFRSHFSFRSSRGRKPRMRAALSPEYLPFGWSEMKLKTSYGRGNEGTCRPNRMALHTSDQVGPTSAPAKSPPPIP